MKDVHLPKEVKETCQVLKCLLVPSLGLTISTRANVSRLPRRKWKMMLAKCTCFMVSMHLTTCYLSFSTNIDSIVSKINSRLFLLSQLKTVGMDTHGLHTFYCTNIRPVLAYAAPAWYFLLSKVDQERLECVQCHATRIILPDLNYLGLRLENYLRTVVPYMILARIFFTK